MQRGVLTAAAVALMAAPSCTKETIIVQNITMVDTTQQTPDVPQPYFEMTDFSTGKYGTARVAWSTDAPDGTVTVNIRHATSDSVAATLTCPSSMGELTFRHLRANTPFRAEAEMKIGKTVLSATSEKAIETPDAPVCEIGQQTKPEAIDLGLSVLWADRNVGATSPEDAGSHVAWGELRTKVFYDEKGWGVPEFVPDSISGSEYYDVCRRTLGDGWRLPTDAEIRELRERCTWRVNIVDKKEMYAILTGPNGNTITLHCAGAMRDDKSIHEDIDASYRSGYYMSGRRGTALRFFVTPKSDYGHYVRTKQEMWMGLSVRAVRDRE